MFESIIKDLQKELDTLQLNMKKCYFLKQSVIDEERKQKLTIKGLEMANNINRAALCISILKSECSCEFADDTKRLTVIFP